MTTINVTEDNIMIDGVASAEVLDSFKNLGYTDAQSKTLLGYLYWGAFGNSAPSSFSFTTDVDETADCGSGYQRTWAHTDWIDGESRVQAGMTPEELGVNARFHGIESEFDKVATELAHQKVCLASLRKTLYDVVQELESKITDLQNKIHKLQENQSDSSSSSYPPWDGPVVVYPTDPTGPVVGPVVNPPTGGGTTPWGPMGPWVNPGPRINPGDVYGPWINPGWMGGSNGPIVAYPGGTTNPGSWINPGGVTYPGAGDVGSWVHVISEMEEVIHKDAEISTDVASGTPVADLVHKFGNKEIGSYGGQKYYFGNMLAGMSSSADAHSAEELTDVLIEHALNNAGETGARNIKYSVLDETAKKRTGAAVMNSDVKHLSGFSDDAATAIKAAGYSTIGKMAAATTEEIMGKLNSAGMSGVAEAEIREGVIAAKLAVETRNY